MFNGGRVEHQWRSPVGLEDVLEESMSETSLEHQQQIPQHPIPTMQGAFEESMEETAEDAEESSLARKDSLYRRKVLLERSQYQRTVAGKWKQKAGEKYHPLWKLIAMLSFGMHLLHQELAKSDDEVIKILQGHVDEVDGFLERTTEDFDLAQHDINERIRYLKLPLEHGDVFDNMLMDRGFRTAMVEGNVKIEHIVDRTTVALTDSLKDTKKGSDGTKELARYLRRLDKTWHGRDEAITEVFQAMMGNTEGWAAAFTDLQDKGKELKKSLEHLTAIIAEIQRLVGIASRRDVPQMYNSADSSRPMSQPMSPQRSQSPEGIYNIASTLGVRSTSHERSQEEVTDTDTQWSRTRTPPGMHPNAILEEEDEYNYSPPRNQSTRNLTQNETRDLTSPNSESQYRHDSLISGEAAGGLAGLGIMARSQNATYEDESGRLTPKPFSRSAYSPQPDIIEEEDEESDDSDYTVDIVNATPITSAPFKAVAHDLDTRHDHLNSPGMQSDRGVDDLTPDYTPPKVEFESSIPKPTRDSIEEARKEFILPPLNLESESSLPALTPLDYERMRADFTLPPFDLRVPEEYTTQQSEEIAPPKISPHPFQRKDNITQDFQDQPSLEDTDDESFERPAITLPIRLPFDSKPRRIDEESPKRSEYPVALPKHVQSPKQRVIHPEPQQSPESVPSPEQSAFCAEPQQSYQHDEPVEIHFIPEPDQFYQDYANEDQAKRRISDDYSVHTVQLPRNPNVARLSDQASTNTQTKPAIVAKRSPMSVSQSPSAEYNTNPSHSNQVTLQLNDESFTPLSQEFESSPTFRGQDYAIEDRFEDQQADPPESTPKDVLPIHNNIVEEKPQDKQDNPSKSTATDAFSDVDDNLEERFAQQQAILNESTARSLSPHHAEATEHRFEDSSVKHYQSSVKDVSPNDDEIIDERFEDQPPNRYQPTVRDALPVAGAVLVGTNTSNALAQDEYIDSEIPTLTKQPRQLPIDNLLVRLRHGNGLITPTEPIHTIPARNAEPTVPKPLEEAVLVPQRNMPVLETTVSNHNKHIAVEQRPPIVVPLIFRDHSQSHQQDGVMANDLVVERSISPNIQRQPEQIANILPFRPIIIEPPLKRRASYSDNRMTQRPAALQHLKIASPELLSPDAMHINSRNYPHSARVPSSGPWTFFSKDDMDHSYRHRRAYSLFSPATPYDLEWLLRRTPSDMAVSPMRWSEVYGFRSGHTSVVSPMGDLLGPHFVPFSPLKRNQTIDSILTADDAQPNRSVVAQKLNRPNSIQIDLAIARGQLSQAAEVKPIQPSWKEPTSRAQKPDRSAVRASSVYSKALDLNSFYAPPGTPPEGSQIIRTETGYTSQYDGSQLSSAYTDATFGQISPAPAISSAKPSPLHFLPRDRIPSEPTSPKEDPKFPVEISDEKHTIVEVPPISPSLKSLVSATITGPEPDFPFLAATYGGPEPDYYYDSTIEPEISARKVTNHEDVEHHQMEPFRSNQQQIIAPLVPQDTTQPPALGNFSTAYGQTDPPKRRDQPPAALNLKLFPSMDSMSRGPTSPRSPRPQDFINDSARHMYPPSNTSPNVSISNESSSNMSNPNMPNPNLLALPPLAQEPMMAKEAPIPQPTKSNRSPLKKLFKDALSPGLLAGRLKRDKDKGHNRGRSSGENNLVKEAALANAQLMANGGGGQIHRPNGSIDTTNSVMRNGSLAGFPDGRRPSGERILFGMPGSDGQPF